MLRYMAGVKWEEGISNEEIMNIHQIGDVRSQIKKQRPRWYGNVERRPPDHILRRTKELEIEQRRSEGRKAPENLAGLLLLGTCSKSEEYGSVFKSFTRQD